MPYDAYRYTALLLGVVGITSWTIWAIRSQRPGYAFTPITWLLNITAFMAWTLFIREPGTQLQQANTWSIIIHLHGLILCAGGALILMPHRVKR